MILSYFCIATHFHLGTSWLTRTVSSQSPVGVTAGPLEGSSFNLNQSAIYWYKCCNAISTITFYPVNIFSTRDTHQFSQFDQRIRNVLPQSNTFCSHP